MAETLITGEEATILHERVLSRPPISYKFSAFAIKIPNGFLKKFEQTILKFLWERNCDTLAKKKLKMKNNKEKFIILGYQNNYKN